MQFTWCNKNGIDTFILNFFCKQSLVKLYLSFSLSSSIDLDLVFVILRYFTSLGFITPRWFRYALWVGVLMSGGVSKPPPVSWLQESGDPAKKSSDFLKKRRFVIDVVDWFIDFTIDLISTQQVIDFIINNWSNWLLIT